MKVIVVGTRPNIVKVGPLSNQLKDSYVVHTGQHYDENMSQSFLEELRVNIVDNLEIGSGTHANQTARIMMGFDDFLDSHEVESVIVVGDVNSTLACALVAAKRGIKISHIESGPRCGNLSVPEEINRVLTDHLSSHLFAPTVESCQNLAREGIEDERIFFVGNISVDPLLFYQNEINESTILERLDLEEKEFCLATVHHPSNVDKFEDLKNTVKILNEVSKKERVVFPVHPRTLDRMKFYSINPRFDVISPLSFFDFVKTLKSSKFVITDSGGIQTDATIHGIPSLQLRERTGYSLLYPKGGRNVLVSNNLEKVMETIKVIDDFDPVPIPPFWDGRTTERICEVLN